MKNEYYPEFALYVLASQWEEAHEKVEFWERVTESLGSNLLSEYSEYVGVERVCKSICAALLGFDTKDEVERCLQDTIKTLNGEVSDDN
ncbi:hypothetical protein FACS189499_06670 [Clostridia bacterium]|nr:hypothetical protein FACS189499_06670 [Clostridia bacterium]